MVKVRKNYNINNFMAAISANWQGDGTTGGFQNSASVTGTTDTSAQYITVTPSSECATGTSTLV